MQGSHFVLRWTEASSAALLEALSSRLHDSSTLERSTFGFPGLHLVGHHDQASRDPHPTDRSTFSLSDPTPRSIAALPRALPETLGPLSYTDFKLLRRLGSGQFAAVYLAVHTASGNPFAVKVCNLPLRPVVIQGHDLLLRFVLLM